MFVAKTTVLIVDCIFDVLSFVHANSVQHINYFEEDSMSDDGCINCINCH